jgi:hypothetical protein
MGEQRLDDLGVDIARQAEALGAAAEPAAGRLAGIHRRAVVLVAAVRARVLRADGLAVVVDVVPDPHPQHP